MTNKSRLLFFVSLLLTTGIFATNPQIVSEEVAPRHIVTVEENGSIKENVGKVAVLQEQEDQNSNRTALSVVPVFVALKASVSKHPMVTTTALTTATILAVLALYKWRKASLEEEKIKKALQFAKQLDF